MNLLWAFMLLLGIGYGLVTGRTAAVTEAVLSGAAEGVELCITMLGVMALWTGIMEIGERAGLLRPPGATIGCPFFLRRNPGETRLCEITNLLVSRPKSRALDRILD